jgi:hypothetical protein
LDVAERSTNSVVAVTHGRNLMALPTLLDRGDKTRIPVMCAVQTAGVVVVEKNAKGWRITADHQFSTNGRNANSQENVNSVRPSPPGEAAIAV